MNSEQSRRIRDFGEIAEKYVAFVEGDALESADDELQRCRYLLCHVHQRIIEVPVLELPDDAHPFREGVDLEIASELYKRGIERFKGLPVAQYWEVFDPLEKDDPITGTLQDDLADIYIDLLKGLNHFRKQKLYEAAFSWRVLFDSHWGHHLIDAQRVLHAYLGKVD